MTYTNLVIFLKQVGKELIALVRKFSSTTTIYF